MKRILCPTDFSSTANNAIAYAAKFAQVTGSEIILFHVQSLFDLPPGDLLKGKSEQVERAKSILEAQALEVSGAFDISCYADVEVSGTSLSTLISKVGSQFDLIVMGTNGPDDLFQFFTGSNTYNVIRKSTVPVLLIPASVEYAELELAVLAYDFFRDGMPPVKQVHDILRSFACEIRVLQLLEVSYSELQEREIEERKEQITVELTDAIPVSFDSLHTDNLPHALEMYVQKNKADLLILNTHHYSVIQRIFHKSITKALSVLADFPVLVIHS